MTLSDFRQPLLNAIQAAKALYPEAHLHLLYAPELADPLQLVGNERREVGLIGGYPLLPQEPEQSRARLVTLDCHRIASYLLESDPGIDDPLFESSITQSYGEVVLGEHVQPAITNDDPHSAVRTVCGWIISTKGAPAMARRISHMSTMLDPALRQQTVRWYHPACFDTLWPGLSADQKRGLLGEAVWFAHDLTGRLRRYEAKEAESEKAKDNTVQIRRLQPVQAQALEDVPIVAALAQSWKGLCTEQGKPLPDNAVEQLHRHVQVARTHRLDADDLAMYALVAVQLPSEAMHAPDMTQVLEQVSSRRSTLRDALRTLPPVFWQRYAPPGTTPHVRTQAIPV